MNEYNWAIKILWMESASPCSLWWVLGLIWWHCVRLGHKGRALACQQTLQVLAENNRCRRGGLLMVGEMPWQHLGEGSGVWVGGPVPTCRFPPSALMHSAGTAFPGRSSCHYIYPVTYAPNWSFKQRTWSETEYVYQWGEWKSPSRGCRESTRALTSCALCAGIRGRMSPTSRKDETEKSF